MKKTAAANPNLKRLEKDITEEERLWKKIKKSSEEDKSIVKKLNDLLSVHRVRHRIAASPRLKAMAKHLFGDIEPPEPKKQQKKHARPKKTKKK